MSSDGLVAFVEQVGPAPIAADPAQGGKDRPTWSGSDRARIGVAAINCWTARASVESTVPCIVAQRTQAGRAGPPLDL